MSELLVAGLTTIPWLDSPTASAFVSYSKKFFEVVRYGSYPASLVPFKKLRVYAQADVAVVQRSAVTETEAFNHRGSQTHS